MLQCKVLSESCKMPKQLDILDMGYETENFGHLPSPLFTVVKAFVGC